MKIFQLLWLYCLITNCQGTNSSSVLEESAVTTSPSTSTDLSTTSQQHTQTIQAQKDVQVPRDPPQQQQQLGDRDDVAAVALAVAESMKKNTPFKTSRLLSFDEWKKENLEKSGQHEIYDMNQRNAKSKGNKKFKTRPIVTATPQTNRRGGSNQDMGMVDELEIDPELFGAGGVLYEEEGVNKNKKYKDRFNYASIDCAATILKTNKEAKGAHNILLENKDSYMLNKCSAPKKFVIVELCQDILVDTVAIGTYEFFSSMFKDIRISVADRYPVPEQEWTVLGEFEAKSVRDLQYFQIKNPKIWARYIRVEFISHWGHEFYCPVSVLRVYGTTMMDEYKKTGQGTTKKTNLNPSAEKVGERGSSDDNVYTALLNETAGNITEVGGGTEIVKQCENITEGRIEETKEAAAPKVPVESEYVRVVDDIQFESECVPENIGKACYCRLKDWQFRTNLYESERMCGVFVNPVEALFEREFYEESQEDEEEEEYEEEEAQETQESIYQTIMKRIALLESNATLSMRYIESQTQSLLEQVVFLSVQQDTKLGKYISSVNSTLVDKLHQLEQFKSHLISVVVTALEEQRLLSEIVRSEDEKRINEKISMLASDLRYQKQIGILQAMTLLIILIFIIATRGASIDTAPVIFNGIRDGIINGSNVMLDDSFPFLGKKGKMEGSDDTNEKEENDYNYSSHDIRRWRQKMAKAATPGRWLVSSGSPESPVFTIPTMYSSSQSENEGGVTRSRLAESGMPKDESDTDEEDENDEYESMYDRHLESSDGLKSGNVGKRYVEVYTEDELYMSSVSEHQYLNGEEQGAEDDFLETIEESSLSGNSLYESVVSVPNA